METHADTRGEIPADNWGRIEVRDDTTNLRHTDDWRRAGNWQASGHAAIPHTAALLLPAADRTLRLPAIVSLPVILAVTIATSFIHHSHWQILAGFLAVMLSLYCASIRNPIRQAKSFFWLLPMVIGVSLAPAASHGWSAGWPASGALLLRSLIAVTAAAWMLAVTPFASILQLLRRCGLPGQFVDTLSLTGRYLHVLRLEFESMQRAQRSRSFGRESYTAAWSRRSQIIGLLILRSLNRAERVHAAMCARGYDGEHRRAD